MQDDPLTHLQSDAKMKPIVPAKIHSDHAHSKDELAHIDRITKRITWTKCLNEGRKNGVFG